MTSEEQSREEVSTQKVAGSLSLSEERTAANIARAKRRNRERLDVADASDRSVAGESTSSSRASGGASERTDKKDHLGEHLTGDASDYFNRPAAGPDDAIATPPWFLEALTKIAEEAPSVPKKSAVVFENTPSAAVANGLLLKSFGFDMGRLIAVNSGTTLGHGSEFWTVSQLRPLLGGYPNFGEMLKVLKDGMS